jgi:hypothetical protein
MVDSGRLSEPFWYTDSPLTTPDPTRPFAGRPPRGAAPPPGPGVIVPDLPVAGGGSLRGLCRNGLLVLAAPGASVDVPVRTPAPVRVVAMTSLSTDLPGVLSARAGELWLIRPDAHVAAVVADEARLRDALCRVVGLAERREDEDGLLPAVG